MLLFKKKLRGVVVAWWDGDGTAHHIHIPPSCERRNAAVVRVLSSPAQQRQPRPLQSPQSEISCT